jgi:hypothetical protein
VSLVFTITIQRTICIDRKPILELCACQNCTFREAYFVQLDKYIFVLVIIATLGLRGISQIVCVARLQSVLQKLTYN